MESPRPTLRLPPGLSVLEGPGERRVRIARGSAWRWPPGVGARRVLAGLLNLVPVAVVVTMAADDLIGPGAAAHDWFLLIPASIFPLAFLFSALRTLAATLRGPAHYRLTDAGIERLPGGVEDPWPWTVPPDPEAADPDRRPVGRVGLSAAQAFWWERVIRRATRPARLAERRRIDGEPFVIHSGGSPQARACLIAVLATALLCAVGAGWLARNPMPVPIVEGFDNPVMPLLIALTVALLWLAARVLYPRVRRGRLTITAAAVAVRRDRPWGTRRRRARLEEVESISTDSPAVLIAQRGGVGRPRKPLRFDAPPGRRAKRIADELRQRLGLSREDRGFPMVVPAGRSVDSTA